MVQKLLPLLDEQGIKSKHMTDKSFRICVSKTLGLKRRLVPVACTITKMCACEQNTNAQEEVGTRSMCSSKTLVCLSKTLVLRRRLVPLACTVAISID